MVYDDKTGEWSHSRYPIDCPDCSQADPVFTQTTYGMSLRDWFAGMALQSAGDLPARTLGAWCYARADAMLKERAASNGNAE